MIQFSDWPAFTPDLTPCAVIQLGAFGGTYFRSIESKITNKKYIDIYKKYKFITKLDPKLYSVHFENYDSNINLFKIKCGQTLQYWETSKWITHYDPYGWFQWYCEFYNGRRCEDDKRQINRWLNRKRIYKNAIKSPKIRQVWLHWAII